MKITRRQLRKIIKEELDIRLNEEEVDIQALGDLVPKRAIQKMVHSLLDDAYGEKINLGYSGERDPKDGTAIPGAISSSGMSGGKHSFDITYSIDMKNPKKVDRIWNNKVRGKAGFRGYYDDNQELDNRGNKIFKMSLFKRPYVADSEFVELVVRITMSDNWVAENSKNLKI